MNNKNKHTTIILKIASMLLISLLALSFGINVVQSEEKQTVSVVSFVNSNSVTEVHYTRNGEDWVKSPVENSMQGSLHSVDIIGDPDRLGNDLQQFSIFGVELMATGTSNNVVFDYRTQSQFGDLYYDWEDPELFSGPAYDNGIPKSHISAISIGENNYLIAMKNSATNLEIRHYLLTEYGLVFINNVGPTGSDTLNIGNKPMLLIAGGTIFLYWLKNGLKFSTSPLDPTNTNFSEPQSVNCDYQHTTTSNLAFFCNRVSNQYTIHFSNGLFHLFQLELPSVVNNNGEDALRPYVITHLISEDGKNWGFSEILTYANSIEGQNLFRNDFVIESMGLPNGEILVMIINASTKNIIESDKSKGLVYMFQSKETSIPFDFEKISSQDIIETDQAKVRGFGMLQVEYLPIINNTGSGQVSLQFAMLIISFVAIQRIRTKKLVTKSEPNFIHN